MKNGYQYYFGAFPPHAACSLCSLSPAVFFSFAEKWPQMFTHLPLAAPTWNLDLQLSSGGEETASGEGAATELP